MNCHDAETTSHLSRIKQTLRIIGKHAAIWPNFDTLQGVMNVSA